MKRLRILTGHHAGALMDLMPGHWSLGSSDDCDVAVSDWTFAQLSIEVTATSVTAHWTAPAEGSTGERHQVQPMTDFMPREFCGTVLCVGPEDSEWPTDVALLATVFEPTPRRIARWAGTRIKARRFVVWWGSVAVTCAVVLSAFIMLAGAKPPLSVQPPIAQVRSNLQKALDSTLPAKLTVSVDHQTLVIEGMLDAAGQDDTVHATVEAARAGYEVQPRFSMASDIAETIRNAVGLPDATVKYLGNGNFSFIAEATDPRAARAAIDRVGADLAPAVRRIDATLESREPDMDAKVLSTLRTDSVEVMQTRDGVKHLVLHTGEASVSPGDVLSLAPPGTLADAISTRAKGASNQD